MSVSERARAFVEILGPLIRGHSYHGASHLERGDVLALAYGAERVHPSPSGRYDKERQRDAARALAERCPLGPTAHVRIHQEAEFLHGTDHVLAVLIAEAGEAAIAAFEVASGWTGVFRVGEVARPAQSAGATIQSTDAVVGLTKIARGMATAVRVRTSELPARPVAIPTTPAITVVLNDGVLVGALADALGLSARNELGAAQWTTALGASQPEAMFATSPETIVGWLAGLSPRVDGKRPGDPCPRCGAALEDPLRDAIQGGHPVGGDADWVGSGPVELCCSGCGVRLATRLRRTQYFDGSATTYE